METLEAEARERARFIADQSGNTCGKEARQVDENGNIINGNLLAPRNADS